MDNDILRLASPLQQDSIVDGPGVRTVLWTQGCIHNCPGCHNPQTHDRTQGILVPVREIIDNIKEAKLQNGLTLSGGEPFLQATALLPIVKEAKQLGWNIWAYTGFTFEDLLKVDAYKQLLQLIDVVVDDKYLEEQKDYRLLFKGSKNQRIIDVQQSLKSGNIVQSAYDDKNLNLD